MCTAGVAPKKNVEQGGMRLILQMTNVPHSQKTISMPTYSIVNSVVILTIVMK